MIYFFGKLHPYFLSPKHYGGQAPASNAPGEGEGDIEPVIEEPVLPSEDPAEDPGPAEPVEEPVVDDDDDDGETPNVDDNDTPNPYVAPKIKKPKKKKKKKQPPRRPKPKDCPECIWDGKQWVRPKTVKQDIIETSGGERVVSPIQSKEKLYKTISCPCGSYAMYDFNGNIACERDAFGLKQYIAPTHIANHTIGGLSPTIGDKWVCTGDFHCHQDDFEFDTFHVVFVEENTSDVTSSLVDSLVSFSNCYIPKTSLRNLQNRLSSNTQYIDDLLISEKNPLAFKGDEDRGINDLPEGIDFLRDLLKFDKKVNGAPVFPTFARALLWENIYGQSSNVYTEYIKDGVVNYLPGYQDVGNKYIYKVFVNNKDVLKLNESTAFNYVSYESQKGRLILDAIGGEIVIKLNSMGKVTVDISIEDSSGCNVLDKKAKNISFNGEYIYRYNIGSLPKNKAKEIYSIKITPNADTSFFAGTEYYKSSVLNYKVYQYKDPVVTFGTSGSITNATITSTNTTVTGKTNRYFEDLPNYAPVVHETTITRSSGSDNYYKKPNVIFENIISDTAVIKKQIVGRKVSGELGECLSEFVAITAPSTDGSTTFTNSDMEPGMRVEGKHTATKTITKIIDIEEHLKEPCDHCDRDLDILTNKIELEDTYDLYVGMLVEGIDTKGVEFNTEILSIDSNKCIELTTQHLFDHYSDLTFTYEDGGDIIEVKNDNTIVLNSCIRLPKTTVLDVYKAYKPKISASVHVDKSGESTVKVTTTINDLHFNSDDVTFDIDVTDVLTTTPNAQDQYITVTKDESSIIDFVRNDTDYNKDSKTLTITQEPKRGLTAAVSVGEGESVRNYPRNKQYTPNKGFVGTDTIKFTLGDGANTSDEKTIYITVK